ncbi:reverse transcriptase domain-containing protein [Metabacillus halosaccharovorans]|uniref:Reverse transcriptase domain-containing protein n=1 Tax=Metabacillus halosaccharovorans TaxID=930124 RepID=A0ABT3DP07_9BACI|nr:reverse transcriptase domain-containing protein [Metabacillus halosaccharovorans]MCV9888769.1 reverse transcriptase domain-containing protein [Metabacillus halosaccharovorans]
MTSDRELMELAYDYIFALSKKKSFNPQTLANYNYFRSNGKRNVIERMKLPIEQFLRENEPSKVKDFVYKSDYFTPRNMFLINPIYYVYYTYLVFKISHLYLDKNKYEIKLDFSKERISAFYSGTLFFNRSLEEIDENAMFNKSYSMFQKERKLYFGNPVLKIDIQNFFSNIKIEALLNKLRKLIGNKRIIDDLQTFFNHCNIDSLPQLHYSIASSILSQFYLHEFDSKIHSTLERENLFLIRFVDDMYIIHLSGVGEIKTNNNILNEISYFLWEDALALNTSKTKMLSAEEYEIDYEITDSEYEDGSTSFSTEILIDEKSTEIIEDGSFITFIEKLCDLEKSNGIDLYEYKNLINEYLSIKGEDSNKVLKNIIFSKKWRSMSRDDLIKLVGNWKYLLFNPTEFTILYVLVYRYLERKGDIQDGGLKIKRILNYLFTNNIFTFRDTLVAVSYLFQSSFKNKELIKKIDSVNPEYVLFVENYIIN